MRKTDGPKMLDIKTCQLICSRLEKLTTTGKDILDTKILKEFLLEAGKSEEYLKFCHEKVLQQLETDHSEIRYGAVLVIEQLFKRSVVYRELLLADFDTFLESTVETNFDKLLPKPYAIAKKLKRKTLQMIQVWNTEYGSNCPNISTAYVFLKTRMKVDFEDALKRTTTEVEFARRKEERQRKIIESKIDVLKVQVDENVEEITKVVTEMNNCFSLLIPKPKDLFGSSEEGFDASVGVEEENVDLREHGLGLVGTTIKINLGNNRMSTVYCTEENQILFENLKELYLVLKNRFLTKIKSWLKLVTKADDTEFFKRIMDLKQLVQDELNRYDGLNIERANSKSEDEKSSDTDDSDFEDVPVKDDYEEFAKPSPVAAPIVPNIASHSAVSKRAEASSWSLWGNSDNDPEDPTTRGATLKTLNHGSSDSDKPSTSKSALLLQSQAESHKMLSRKEKLLQVAPKLPYDNDLYHWEDADEELTAPSVELVESDSHRFWQPSDREGEVIESADGVASLRTRTIEFSGTYEPVKWTCRTPLTNGKLCPRKDRIKCPFHGKIIGRDEAGIPTNSQDIVELNERLSQEDRPPDWQDPVFLKDLQAQIGIDLTIRTSKRSRKPKTFAEKYPGLTDIQKEKNSPRARLAKKVFNRNSMKRVGQAEDVIAHKKYLDKYSEQYQYSYNQ